MVTAATISHGNWHDDDFLSFAAADYGEENHESHRTVVTKRPLPKQRQKAEVSLPPWMTQPHKKGPGFRAINPMVALHNEIVDFCSLMEPRLSEIQTREALVVEISEIISTAFSKKEECSVNLFGSQATGLFLPSSDIDLVVMLKQTDGKTDSVNDEEREWRTEKQSPLFRVADALKEAWRGKLSYLEVIEQTRVPLVKCTHKPSGVSIDICFNQQTGVKAAALMTTFLKAMPPLRPLTFVLKYFTASRGLNEPYSGGIGSFLLQLLIVSFLQHRERDAINFRRPSPYNLGCLLVEFCELYGIDFNFLTTAISVRHDGYYFPKGAKDKREHFFQPSRPFSLAVENPLDTTMDVGKPSFRIHLVQRTLDSAFRVLRCHVTVPITQSGSILKSILPLTDEMWERRKMLMADGNEDMWEGSSIEGEKEVLLTNHPLQKYNDDDLWGSDSDDEEVQPINKKARNKY